MSRRLALRGLRADERGFTLVEVIVSTLIDAVVVSLVASAIFAFAVVQQGFQTTASNTSVSSVVATVWGSSVQSATKISVTDTGSATFSEPAANATCSEKTFAFVAATGAVQLQMLLKSFSGPPDPTDGGCTGVAGSTSAAVLDGDASGNDSMTFASVSGRGMTFSSGALTLDTTAQPAGVSAAAWASTIIGSATAHFTVNASTKTPKSVSIVQLATGQTVVPPADATSTLVTS